MTRGASLYSLLADKDAPVKGAFLRAILYDKDASPAHQIVGEIHDSLMRYLAWSEVRKGKLVRKSFTIADYSEIVIDDAEIMEDTED